MIIVYDFKKEDALNIQKLDRECTGCGCCANVCFKNCITMEYNKEGFKHPVVDESTCVNCAKCIEKCPVSDFKKEPSSGRNTRLSVPDTYVAFAKDLGTRKQSASGGIATVLSQTSLENGGVVCGAVMTEEFDVIHTIAKSEEDLMKVSGSKYVQSDITHNYPTIKKYLDEGRFVVCTGAGCQIAGIKSYLSREYENLYCVDIVCTGVTPPRLFSKYLKRCHKNVKSLRFHTKDRGWAGYTVRIDYHKKKPKIESGGKNLYSIGFLSGMFLRKSCYECCFRGENSQADITLGDPWGGLYHGRLGASMVLVNTEKGRKIFEMIENKIRKSEVTLDYLMRCNGYFLSKSKRKPKNRDKCIRQLLNTRFMKLQMQKWCGQSRLSKKLRSC